MQVVLDKVGKRYNRNWVFKDLSYQFSNGKSYAVIGANGSGKSTLIQIISGYLSTSQGEIKYLNETDDILVEDIFNKIGLAAPYVDLLEDLTLSEAIKFHFQFKNCLSDIVIESIPELIGLTREQDKMLKDFSSGMKQRTRLAFAFFSDAPIILLDEPTTNLDETGVAWYKQLVDTYLNDRLLIVSSNQKREYDFCDEVLNMEDWNGDAK